MRKSPTQSTLLLRHAGSMLLVLLLMWGPYVQGLYTDAAQLIAFGQAGVALTLLLLHRPAGGAALRLSPVRVAATALWLAYVAALVVAVSPRQAIQEVYKYGLFLMVLLAMSELARQFTHHDDSGIVSSEQQSTSQPRRGRSTATGDRGLASARMQWLIQPTWRSLITVFWAAAAVFALATLLSAVGVLPAYQHIEGRLWTLMSYPNSAGALLGAALLMGTGLRRARPLGTSEKIGDAALSAGQWLLGATLLLTMSRGAWLVAPLGFIALLAFWPAGRRVLVCADLALTLLAVFVAAPFLIPVYGRPVEGTLILVGGLLLGLVAGSLNQYYSRLAPKSRLALASAAVLLLVALPVGLLASDALPDHLARRLTAFSLAERSFFDRLTWTRDAWAIVRDHPVLGVGGGGWASIYFSYQSFGYVTAEVHNDFLEVWVETGTIGFISLITLLGLAARAAWRLRGKVDGRLLGGTVGAGALLIMHLPLDLDWALGYVGIYLWGLIGLLDGISLSALEPAAKPAARHTQASLWPRMTIIGVALLLTLPAASLLSGYQLGSQAVELAQSGRVSEAYSSLVRATSYDPWARQLRANRALIAERMYIQTRDQGYLEDAFQQARLAIDTEPYSPVSHQVFADIAFRQSDMVTAAAEYSRALELDPFRVPRYERAAEAHLRLGMSHLELGNQVQAQTEFKQVVGLLDRMAVQSQTVPSGVEVGRSMPSRTPTLLLQAGKALLLLGQPDTALPYLTLALDASLDDLADEEPQDVRKRRVEAAIWLSAYALSAGDEQSAESYLDLVPDRAAAELTRDGILRLLSLANET